MTSILITGSAGLVGRALRRELEAHAYHVVGFDRRARAVEEGDVRDAERVAVALQGVSGVVHLAAVSRVVWAERDPAACWSTNVEGLHNILTCARSLAVPPWIVFASSREVYGLPTSLPVSEDAPLRPVNVYGRSKLAGEELIRAARRDGLRACVVRLSNVYGSTLDHADRVVPAFARAAVAGSRLRVDGADHEFDFTHVEDVAAGLYTLVDCLVRGVETPPPIHFVSGTSTTLGRLARLAISLAKSASKVEPGPERSFDVARFRGSGARARALLGWTPRIGIEHGLGRLVEEFRAG